MRSTGSKRLAWAIPAEMTELGEIERHVIVQTLKRTGGNKSSAARLLGIWRPRLYQKLRKYGIDVKRRR